MTYIFCYSGQGARGPDSYKRLLTATGDADASVFQRMFADCNAICKAATNVSFEEAVLTGNADLLQRYSVLVDTIAGICLTQVVRSWGIHPAAVIGHSSGELCALYLSGGLSLEETLKLATYCSEALCACGGTLLSVEVPSPTDLPRLEAEASAMGLEIACYNSPRYLVLGGSVVDVERFKASEPAQEFKPRSVQVRTAYHTRLVQSGLEDLSSKIGAKDLVTEVQTNTIPFYSTMTGVQLSKVHKRHVVDLWRKPVRFTQAVSALVSSYPDQSAVTYVEVGPHITIGPHVSMIVASLDPAARPTTLNLLQRKADELETLADARALLASPEPSTPAPAPTSVAGPCKQVELSAALEAAAGGGKVLVVFSKLESPAAHVLHTLRALTARRAAPARVVLAQVCRRLRGRAAFVAMWRAATGAEGFSLSRALASPDVAAQWPAAAVCATSALSQLLGVCGMVESEYGGSWERFRASVGGVTGLGLGMVGACVLAVAPSYEAFCGSIHVAVEAVLVLLHSQAPRQDPAMALALLKSCPEALLAQVLEGSTRATRVARYNYRSALLYGRRGELSDISAQLAAAFPQAHMSLLPSPALPIHTAAMEQPLQELQRHLAPAWEAAFPAGASSSSGVGQLFSGATGAVLSWQDPAQALQAALHAGLCEGVDWESALGAAARGSHAAAVLDLGPGEVLCSSAAAVPTFVPVLTPALLPRAPALRLIEVPHRDAPSGGPLRAGWSVVEGVVSVLRKHVPLALDNPMVTFMDLGATSKLLVGVVNELRQVVPSGMSVVLLFQFPSFKELLDHVTSHLHLHFCAADPS